MSKPILCVDNDGVKALIVETIKARINDLKIDARAEGHQVSTASENDFFAFINTIVFTRRPYITLLDNGSLRAHWKNLKGEELHLQFCGGKEVQFVFFVRRPNCDFIARVFGRDILANIKHQIDEYGLGRLIAE